MFLENTFCLGFRFTVEHFADGAKAYQRHIVSDFAQQYYTQFVAPFVRLGIFENISVALGFVNDIGDQLDEAVYPYTFEKFVALLGAAIDRNASYSDYHRRTTLVITLSFKEKFFVGHYMRFLLNDAYLVRLGAKNVTPNLMYLQTPEEMKKILNSFGLTDTAHGEPEMGVFTVASADENDIELSPVFFKNTHPTRSHWAKDTTGPDVAVIPSKEFNHSISKLAVLSMPLGSSVELLLPAFLIKNSLKITKELREHLALMINYTHRMTGYDSSASRAVHGRSRKDELRTFSKIVDMEHIDSLVVSRPTPIGANHSVCYVDSSVTIKSDNDNIKLPSTTSAEAIPWAALLLPL